MGEANPPNASLTPQRAGSGDNIQHAEAVARQILAANPNHPEALNLLALIMVQRNQLDAALELTQRAVAISPSNPVLLNSLGALYHKLGRLEPAVEAWKRAVTFKPDDLEIRCNLGCGLQHLGRTDDAIACFREVLRMRPNFVVAMSNLAGSLSSKGQWDEAIALCRQTVALAPADVNACRVLAMALQTQRQFEEAIVWYRRALSHGDDPDMYSSLGTALQSIGNYQEAEAAYRRAIAIAPRHAGAHFNLALLLLLLGDFEQGWREYQWRWDWKQYAAARQRFRQPEWDGSDITGRTILLHTEQGFGDAIQFVRYATLVAQRGAKVILGCMQPTTRRLLAAVEGVSQAFTTGEPLPDFDFHAPLLSLPWIFRTTLTTVPACHAYLKAEPELSAKWRERMSHSPARLRVGLCWASGSLSEGRSLTLSDLAPLARVPGVRFYSLQKGETAMQAKTPPPGMMLEDWTDELRDFSDTAALTDNLNLVISVDTAVAHLAGAMGKPVFLLVKHVPDWRWMLDREDTPWYPTMRLFRQSARDNWGPIIEILATVMEHFANMR